MKADTPHVPHVKGNPQRGDADSYTAKLERQNRRQARVNITQHFTIISLVIALVMLFPLKEKIPYLVRFGDPADKVYTLTPGQLDVTQQTALAETAITDYVRKRETIDHLTAPQRDKWLRVYSSDPLWKFYVERYSPQNPKNPRVLAQRAGVTRSIYISATTPVNGSRNTYNVFFTTVDTITGTGEETKRKDWIATLTYTTRHMVMDTSEFQMNPTGITIVNYDIRRRTLGENQQ